MKKHYLLSALTLALLASLGHARPAAPPPPRPTAKAASTLASGIATQYIDPAVRAQDDFFDHLNGKWLKTVEIPADKSSWGSFSKLRRRHLPQLRGIIEKAAAGNAGQGHRRPAHRRLLRQLHGRGEASSSWA